MTPEEKEGFYPYVMGVSVVVVIGSLTIFVPGLNNWEKKLMYACAFIFFIACEPIWIWGKRVLGRGEK